MHTLLDPTPLLETFGAIGVFVVLFAETGLLVGFFLPGDSLLFTAGLLCSTSATTPAHLSLPAVLVAAPGGALARARGPGAARRRPLAGRRARLPNRAPGRAAPAGPAGPPAPPGRRAPLPP